MLTFSPLEHQILPFYTFIYNNFDFSLTNVALINLISFFGFWALLYFASSNKNCFNSPSFFFIPGPWQTVIESIYDMLSQLVSDLITVGSEKYFPFLTIIFSFILFSNVIGLIPYNFTITSYLIIIFTLSFSIFNINMDSSYLLVIVLTVFKSIFVIVFVLIAVAFSTVVERKTMGVIPRRRGQNVSYTCGESNQTEVKLIRRNYVVPEAFIGSFRTRSSLIGQNKLKVCFVPKGARFFSSNRTNAGPENHRTIKTILFDMFLKYQFTICVEPKIPFSHLMPLSLLTCIFGSFYYIKIYCISIFYIIFTLYIAEKFPDSFGSRYLSFLKRNSSTEAFEKYCGNSWGALKAAIKHPEFIKVVAKNGVGKAIVCTGAALVVEHILHEAQIGQIYKYKVDQYLNEGKHKPFSFKPHNGPSMLDKVIGRDGK